MIKTKSPDPRRSEAAKRGWETRRKRMEESAELERADFPPIRFFPRERRLGVSDQTSQAQLLQAYKGWAAVATNAIAEEVKSLRPYVAVEEVQANGTIQHRRLDSPDHPLVTLLRNPSPNFSLINLLWLIGLWVPQVGEAYFVKVTDQLGVVRQLEPIKPSNVEIVGGRFGVDHYVYRSPQGGRETIYQPEEVLRIYEPDPDDPFLARGKLSSQALIYDTALFLDQTMRKHWKEDATPKVAIKAQDGAQLPTGADRKRWEKEWRDAYNRRDGISSGVPSMLPPGFEPHEFSFWSGKDLVPVMKFLRDQVLSAYGVPASVLGLNETINR